MLLDIPLIAAGMAGAFLSSLRKDSATIRALAGDEAQKLTRALTTIAQLLESGDIDAEEAEALIDVQRAATEAVFASLEGIGRVVARRATRAGLTSAVTAFDGVIGFPLLAGLTAAAAPRVADG